MAGRRLVVLVLSLLVGYLAWRSRVERTKAAQWTQVADSLHRVNTTLLDSADSLVHNQQRLTLALERGAADRARLANTAADLSTEIARMRKVLPKVAPDTCLPWVALSDTLTRLVSVEAQRADSAEKDVLRANAGRQEALAAAAALRSRLRVTDSTLAAHPKVTPPFLALLLDARVGSDGTAQAVAALRRGAVYVGVGVGSSVHAVIGYRADFRLF